MREDCKLRPKDRMEIVSVEARLAKKLLEMRHYQENVHHEVNEVIDSITELNPAFSNRVFEELKEEDTKDEAAREEARKRAKVLVKR